MTLEPSGAVPAGTDSVVVVPATEASPELFVPMSAALAMAPAAPSLA